MKKTLVIMLALFLAIPAISYAGSATSRWDLTIGGSIKFDVGWADQSGGTGSDMWAAGDPNRNPAAGNTQLYDKYGTQLWGAGESGLNFFVKGPDAWGAHTHAFIAADWTGLWGSYQGGPPANYNMLDLAIAEIGFDWDNTTIDMGTGASWWGMPMTFTNSNAFNDLGFGIKGAAPITPQITIVERFTKQFSAGFGVMTNWNSVNQLQTPAGTGGLGPAAESSNDYRNTLPAFEGKISYSSDSCGKVGPWQLLAELDGFYGQQTEIYGANLSHKEVDQWFVDFKMLLPIIPEKNGNKASALYADAELYWSTGMGGGGNWMANAGPPWLTDIYQRATPGDYHAAGMWGAVAHGQYYFTDAVSINVFYEWAQVNSSNALNNSFYYGPTGAINRGYQWTANLLYDVNPAIRFTLQWDYTDVHYVPPLPNYKSDGTQNVYKFSAQYFF